VELGLKCSLQAEEDSLSIGSFITETNPRSANLEAVESVPKAIGET